MNPFASVIGGLRVESLDLVVVEGHRTLFSTIPVQSVLSVKPGAVIGEDTSHFHVERSLVRCPVSAFNNCGSKNRSVYRVYTARLVRLFSSERVHMLVI